MAADGTSLFLAGDAMMVRPWSQVEDPDFLRMVDEIRAADVAITNLETVLHEFNAFAQSECGGVYMASPPAIAAELKWAGFDMVAHASNHTFDYGSSAVLETIGHAEKAGLVLAGAGRDLQSARAARYFGCSRATVALVAMASDFIPYGRASRSRPDFHGRPGLNPLTMGPSERAIVVPPKVADRLRAFGRMVGRKPAKLLGPSFKVGFRFHVGDGFGVERGRQLIEGDRLANLDAISEAAGKADIVVASIHAHRQGRWLKEFAGEAITRGADVVFVHGPHRVRAVELRAGKPIFYSMGDFVVELADIPRFPAEAYERFHLGDDASPKEYLAAARAGPLSIIDKRSAYEGFAASLSIANGRVSRIRLIPLDLQFDASEDRRGRPQIAPPAVGKRIVERVAALSRRLGTSIRYDAAANCGEVEVP